jgi:hypothetical protein
MAVRHTNVQFAWLRSWPASGNLASGRFGSTAGRRVQAVSKLSQSRDIVKGREGDVHEVTA